LKETKRVIKPGGILIMQSYQYNFYDMTENIYIAIKSAFRKKNGPSENRSKILHRRYSKSVLDRLLEKYGFKKLDYIYNNFRLFPCVLEHRMPKAYIKTSEFLSRFLPRHFGFFAANYIAKYKLESS